MSSNKVEKFLLRKSVVLILILIGLSQVVFRINLAIFLGLIIGYFVSLIRLRVLSSAAKGVLSRFKKNNIGSGLNYIGVQIITILVLVVAIKISIPVFLAASLGILTIPITIMINSFTEFLGATRNNFEWQIFYKKGG